MFCFMPTYYNDKTTATCSDLITRWKESLDDEWKHGKINRKRPDEQQTQINPVEELNKNLLQN